MTRSRLVACVAAVGVAAGCTQAAQPRSERTPSPAAASATAMPAEPCAVAQAPVGAAGVSSSLPVVVLASGIPTAEDLYSDGDRLLVGAYSTGRVYSLGDQPVIRQLPGAIPEVEGITRLAGALYVADQLNDRIDKLAEDGTVTTFFQLRPVPGLEGVDQIASDGRSLIVPDSARGNLLWLSPDGSIQRTVGGFARPTGAWPVPDGSVLVSDENGGRVYSVAADGTKTVLASGLPLDDDVARTADGRVFTISITLAGLYELVGGRAQPLATGLAQPQGLELDHAGNPIVTEYDRGRVDKVVTTFAALPAADPVMLRVNQPLCVQLARAPAFADAVAIAAGGGYRVTSQPGPGSQGEVLPDPCAQSECAVKVTLGAGDRSDAVWLRYAGT